MKVLDLFSAAAGGWSLGMHRAGFRTVAACEAVEWRRILYSENNPGVPVYDDVTTLRADRLVRDGVGLPDIIVGSPPCQDISSANTKGKGVDGERSGLYFEAVRLIDECRPDWYALENSANLRTRGADRVIAALESVGYTCWPFVVSAGDVGANHERKRSWLIGFNARDAEKIGWRAWWSRRCAEPVAGLSEQTCGYDGNPDSECRAAGECPAQAQRPDDIGPGWFRPGADHERGAPFRQPGIALWHDADAGEAERRAPVERAGDRDGQAGERREGADRHAEPAAPCGGNPADADEARQPAGLQESSLRSAQEPYDGRGDVGCDDVPDADGEGQPDRAEHGEMGRSPSPCPTPAEPWADWNGGLAHHLRVDDGLSAWVAGTRIALGSRKGTAAASLIVEAFGDAVVPQIPEAIGRAISRVEASMRALHMPAANDNQTKQEYAA